MEEGLELPTGAKEVLEMFSDFNKRKIIEMADEAIKSFYTKDTSKVNFYEVTDAKGVAVWGGENQNQAIAFFVKDIFNQNLIVTGWHTTKEDARPVGGSLDITPLVLAAIAEGRSRGGGR